MVEHRLYPQASAFAPSITTRIGRLTSRPRSAKTDGRSSVTTVALLDRALDEAERVLGPVEVDAEGDETAVIGEVHPVDHDPNEIELCEVS